MSPISSSRLVLQRKKIKESPALNFLTPSRSESKAIRCSRGVYCYDSHSVALELTQSVVRTIGLQFVLMGFKMMHWVVYVESW